MALVGIDLGSTYSVVATMEAGQVVVISNAEGGQTTPSMVFFPDSSLDNAIVGEAALRSAATAPDRVVRNIKRHLGTPFTFCVDGQTYTPEQIASVILKKLKTDAEAYLGEPVTHAVMTVPAYFDAPAHLATKKAAKLAGLNVVALLPEPIAAVMDFARTEGDTLAGKTVMVYDLGGASFGVTVIAVRPRVGDPREELDFTILGHNGNRELGGDDWDARLAQLICQGIAKAHGGKSPEDGPASYQRLLLESRNLKELLSYRPEVKTTTAFVHEGIGHRFSISRREFEDLTSDLLEETASRCHELVNSLKEKQVLPAGWESVDTILLAGGASKMPCVAEMLERLVGKKAVASRDLEFGVVRGAAYLASSPDAKPPVIPEKDASRPAGSPQSLDLAREQSQWKEELEIVLCFGQHFMETYHAYLEEGERLKLQHLLASGKNALATTDRDAGRRHVEAIRRQVFSSGTASVLFVAERALAMADAEAARELSSAMDAVRHAHQTRDPHLRELCHSLADASRQVFVNQQTSDENPPVASLEGSETASGPRPVTPRPRVGAASPTPAASPSPSPRPAPPKLDENVQFTVYRPRVVQPDKWYHLLAFAHLAEKRVDAPPEEPDPVQDVKEQARQILGVKAAEYEVRTDDSKHPVPRRGEITFIPEVPGIEFNPPRRSFVWQESVQREDFRMRAATELDGRTARGQLSIFLGAILLGDVPLVIRVDKSHQPARANEPLEPVPARRYRQIFASYSHKDLPIVEQFELFAQSLGDDYLRDWRHLRAGEVWNEKLMRMIDQADVFQLFWSRNSMVSDFVRQEWEYALSLGRDHFVRPTYWEDPMPSAPGPPPLPPPNLARLHFQRISASLLPAATPPDSLRHADPVLREAQRQSPASVAPPVYMAPEQAAATPAEEPELVRKNNEASRAAEAADWDRAIELLRQAAKEAGNDARDAVIKNLATCLHSRALQRANRALEHGASWRASYAAASAAMAELRQAEEDLIEAITLDPRNDNVHMNLHELTSTLHDLQELFATFPGADTATDLSGQPSPRLPGALPSMPGPIPRPRFQRRRLVSTLFWMLLLAALILAVLYFFGVFRPHDG